MDSNILLELLLEREKAAEVKRFLTDTQPDQLHLSEFTLNSLGVFLLREKKSDVFLRFIDEVLEETGVQVLNLVARDMRTLVNNTRQFNLDFDDSYQYTLAEKYNLTLLSFDKDFDRTERGRKTPAEILQS